MFGRKKKNPPPLPDCGHTDCGHTEEQHRAIFLKALQMTRDEKLWELPEPLPFPLSADDAPMRGLNAWH
jgi:hypothetical protein